MAPSEAVAAHARQTQPWPPLLATQDSREAGGLLEGGNSYMYGQKVIVDSVDLSSHPRKIPCSFHTEKSSVSYKKWFPLRQAVVFLQAVLLGCCALIERSAVMSAVEHAHHIPGCAALQLEHFDALAALSVASASSAAASVAASVSALAASARRCAGCCSRGMTLFGARQRCRTLFSSPCALTASARPRSPNALALTVPLRARFAQVHGLPAWQPAPDGQDLWPRL